MPPTHDANLTYESTATGCTDLRGPTMACYVLIHNELGGEPSKRKSAKKDLGGNEDLTSRYVKRVEMLLWGSER